MEDIVPSAGDKWVADTVLEEEDIVLEEEDIDQEVGSLQLDNLGNHKSQDTLVDNSATRRANIVNGNLVVVVVVSILVD